MKTIWNKIPAWIKAIILAVVIVLPVVTLVQSIVIFNLKSNTGWGWALLVTIPVLIIFWKLVQRFTSFSKPEDVKIKMNLNWSDKKVWIRIIGLVLATITTIELFSLAFGDVPEVQNAFLQTFKQFNEITALPLLFALALSAGVVEEVVYRGIIQNVLVRAYPKTRAFIMIGLLFGLLHFLPVSLLLPYLLVSIFFSLVANEFKSLGAVIIAHALTDLLYFIYGYFVEFDKFETDQLLPLSIGFILSIFFLLYGNNSILRIRKNKLSLQK
ncbi:MAG: CPBP family intramembrane glutamic endopeptidase [Eudoraea sp.]|uniref:CPBP family intramembrane glutamic endopeptidase n=1 Tax=Eudoraea sp. TaxID=1979955 RepID=UPI003264CD55